MAPEPSAIRMPRTSIHHPHQGALAVAVARRIDDIQEGRWTVNDTIGCSRTASSNEIDFAAGGGPYPSRHGDDDTDRKQVGWNRLALRGPRDRGETRRRHHRHQSILDLEHPAWAVPALLVVALARMTAQDLFGRRVDVAAVARSLRFAGHIDRATGDDLAGVCDGQTMGVGLPVTPAEPGGWRPSWRAG